MTFKKILVRLITVAFLVSSIQISSFAASDGRVDKVLTVGEAEVLQGNEAPKLLIHLKDALQTGDIFYLELEGAQWQEEVSAKVAGNEDVVLAVRPTSESELQIKVEEGEVAADQTIEIALNVQLTAGQARVKIDGNNTSIEDQTFEFAKTMPYTGEVTVSGVETVTSNGTMGKLVINEPFSGAFAKAVSKGKSPVVTICLDTNDYAFDIADEKWQLKGTKGFEGLNGEKIRKVDAQTLEVTLPDTKDYKNKGSFELTGINLVAQSKENMPKEVGVTVSGDLVKEANLKVLKVNDYEITLKSELQKVYAGSAQKVRFELEEVVDNSLVRQRPTTFTVTNGAYLMADEEGKVKVWLNGKETECQAVMEGEKAIGFELETLPEEKVNTFEVETYIPAECTGEVKVLATGRSLIEDLSVPVLEVQVPFNVDVTPFEVEVGVKDQVGGAIEIAETAAGRIMQDENIVIDLEDSNIDVTKLPTIEVTSGDLRVGKAKIEGHRLVIPVTRKSHSASTLKISDFKVTAGQNTAYGTYEVTIGGGALSHLGEGEMKAPVKQVAFIEAVENKRASNDQVVEHVGDKKDQKGSLTADIEQSDEKESTSTDEVKEANKKEAANEQIISFKADEKAYTVDDETHELSVAPYEKDDQLMVSAEGVLAVLGLSEEAFEWESSTRTVTFKSQPQVAFTIGEDAMHVGDKVIPLETPAELTHGKTYIPMNALCEALGMSYYYEKSSLTIYRI